jgi:hypothetical protein
MWQLRSSAKENWQRWVSSVAAGDASVETWSAIFFIEPREKIEMRRLMWAGSK